MAADNEAENLKTACFAALRKSDEDAFEEAAENLQQSQSADLQFKMETLGLLACFALKQNLRRSALKALNILSVCSLDIAAGDAGAETIFLQNLHHTAAMAARTHDKDFFAAAVSKLAVRYSKTSYVKENTEAFINLLMALMFIAADRRYIQVLPMLQWLSLRLCRNEAAGNALLLPFLREWACLAAQAARRDWPETATGLLNGLFYFLLKQRSFELNRSVLLYVMMHMQMYAAWDGIDKALKIYAPVQKFSLLLLQRAVKASDETLRIAAVRMLLRAWRDFIAAAARQGMQDEMELYQSWFAFSQSYQGSKYSLRSRLLIQLTLGYWAAQQPRTSKKQLKYLKNIFETDLVKDKYLQLLEAVR